MFFPTSVLKNFRVEIFSYLQKFFNTKIFLMKILCDENFPIYGIQILNSFPSGKKKQSGNQLINWNGLTVPLIITSCTNSGVLSSTVLDGMKLEILEPLSWLML